MSYEYDPAKVPPNPPPPEATTIGPVSIEGGGSTNIKTFNAVVGAVNSEQTETDKSGLKYEWTVNGEGQVEGARDEESVNVRVAKGITTVTVKVYTDDDKCTNSPQFATIEIDYVGVTGGSVISIDESIIYVWYRV